MSDDEQVDEVDEASDDAEEEAPDPLSRLVARLAEEKIIQPSLADFLR